MQKLKTERGITLIALIITIIVMLILVGVTVSISLNGGLFTTAKEATNKTQVEIDKEQLLELALGAIGTDGKVDEDKLDEAITADERFTGEDGTYTSVKSGKTYIVNDWGGVETAPELSGKWKFNEDIEAIPGSPVGWTISQDISFVAEGWIDSDGDYEEDTIGWSRMYTSITYEAWEMQEPPGDDYNSFLHFEDMMASYEDTIPWELEYDENGVRELTRVIDFGSTPQPVSQEFYEWFTINADPVQ